MVQNESGFQACGAAVHHSTRDIYPFFLQLLLDPLSWLIASHNSQYADFRPECDLVVGEVCGPSEHKFLRDELCHWDGCFSRELSALRANIPVNHQVSYDQDCLILKAVDYSCRIGDGQCQLGLYEERCLPTL